MKAGRPAIGALVAVAYAGCFVAIELGLAHAPPFRFAAGRALVAGLVLLGVSTLTGHGVAPPRRLRSWTLVLGAILAVQYAAMFLSPGLAGAGLSSVLANTGPVLLVVLAALFLHERITWVTGIAVLLGTAGVVLITWPASDTGAGPGGIGLLVPVGVAIGAALETLLLKWLDVGKALLPVVAWQLILGALPLLAASAVTESAPVHWSPGFLAALAFLALPGTAMALALWYWLVQREPVSRLAAFMFMVPVAGLLLAWAVLGETVSSRQTLGLALALSGILLSSGAVGRRWSARAHMTADPRPTPHPGRTP